MDNKQTPPLHSKYYTLDATKEELQQAIERAEEIRQKPIDCIGHDAYAVLYGYENTATGKIKLLKNPVIYRTKKSFKLQPGMKGHKTLAVVEEEIDYSRFL